MKISTKGRYALRLMLDLASAPMGEYRPLKVIADNQDLSEKYLEQIITQLNRAGYVHSIRGAHGGYRLANPPKDYTVGMILRLTEGSLAPVACLSCDPNPCPRQDSCATLLVWKKLDEAISDVVDHITLEDLLHMQQELPSLVSASSTTPILC